MGALLPLLTRLVTWGGATAVTYLSWDSIKNLLGLGEDKDDATGGVNWLNIGVFGLVGFVMTYLVKVLIDNLFNK